jgi:hypothetical protein
VRIIAPTIPVWLRLRFATKGRPADHVPPRLLSEQLPFGALTQLLHADSVVAHGVSISLVENFAGASTAACSLRSVSTGSPVSRGLGARDLDRELGAIGEELVQRRVQ